MTDRHTFRTIVEVSGKSATGLPVPAVIVEALGSRRPAVRVIVGSYSYRTTIGSVGGRFLVPLSAEHRAAAGVAGGQEVEVTLEADTATRDVTVPDDLARALADDPAAHRFFAALAYSHRKEWVRWIEDAKKPDTRDRRLEATLAALRDGKRRR